MAGGGEGGVWCARRDRTDEETAEFADPFAQGDLPPGEGPRGVGAVRPGTAAARPAVHLSMA
ncbi:hypothetical protein CXR04_14575 [Streptomyces sp. CMB-StM0423]|nr:hypothetical protein CXR04_14575 [Streptomyces sp. CMB-StM0423]